MEARLTCRVSLARSPARSRDAPFPVQQGGADDAVRYIKVLRPPALQQSPATTPPSAFALSHLYSARAPLSSPCPSLSLYLLLFLRAVPHLTREAAERSIPFLAPILHRFRPSPPCLPAIRHSIPFRPLSRSAARTPQSLLSLQFAPFRALPQRVTLSLIQHVVPASGMLRAPRPSPP